MNSDHDIIIVGGGAGGLQLAARLGRRLGAQEGRRRVLLIDRSIFHLWKPSIHEVAAGSLNSYQEGLAYTDLARRNHFSFDLGALVFVDTATKTIGLGEILDDSGEVLVQARALSFGTLVLATGSGSNLYDTPGAAEHVYLLEDVKDAESFHRRLTALFLTKAYADEPTLRIAIVGGGATGVELSAELLEGHRELSEDLSPEQRFNLTVTIVESGPRILGPLPEDAAGRASNSLANLGIHIRTGAKVTAVHSDHLETNAGTIPCDLAVWAAGIKAADANRSFGLPTGRANQFIVDDRLRTPVAGIYAMGDCAEAPGPNGKPVPPRAQAAARQATYLTRLLLDPDRDHGPYVYRERMSLVQLGKGNGVGSVTSALTGRLTIVQGAIAKWGYFLLFFGHYRGVLGIWRTLLMSVSRLMRARINGRIKLH